VAGIGAVLVVTPLFGVFRGGQLSLFLVLGLITVSLDLVWGFAGILSLGQSIPFGIAASLTAQMTLATPELGLVVIAVGVISGAVVAFAIAQAAFRRSLSPIVIGLLTLMLPLTIEAIVRQLRNLTGGFNGLTGIPRIHIGAYELADRTQDVVISIAVILTIVAVMALVRRPLGAVLIGIRDNERRMSAFGYNTVNLKIWIFTLAGAIAGLAGALYAPRTGFVSPGLFGFVFATNLVLWTLIGGRGTIVGPVIGTLLISFATAALADMWLQAWVLATGIMLVLAVLFVPEGLIPAVQRLRGRPSRAAATPTFNVVSSTGRRYGADDVLSVNGLSLTYGLFTAIDDLSMTMTGPQLQCVIGPNGAGKTTLLDSLCGQQRPTAGTVHLLGLEMTGRRPWEFARHGVSRKFQTPEVFTALTVAENIAIASWGTTASFWSLITQGWEATISPGSDDILRRSGLSEQADRLAETLSHGEKQWLEIAMAMASDCRLLLLDEPTAGFTAAESQEAAAMLRELHDQYDLPVVIVEHDMAFIRSVADRVTVLARGALLADGTVAEMEVHPDVRALYLGNGRRA
jgi:branched-chain amino acid transport system permease protein